MAEFHVFLIGDTLQKNLFPFLKKKIPAKRHEKLRNEKIDGFFGPSFSEVLK